MATSDPFTLSITPGEIIAPGTTIQLTAERPIDARSAQGAVRVTSRCERHTVSVALARRGRALTIATRDLPPGPYELTVDELLDARGGRLTGRLVVPFLLAALAGEVPDELRVEHGVRLVVGELSVERHALHEPPPPAYVNVVKAVGRKDGAPVELAFDERGARVDADELLAGVAKRRFERYGRLHETLWERVAGADDDERFEIAVWPRIELPPAPYDKPTEGRLEGPPAGEKEVVAAVRKAGTSLRRALTRAGVAVAASAGERVNPVLHATATAGQIRELARSAVVGAIHLDDPTEILDLKDSIAVARSGRAHTLGFDGSGIRVAVWESGPSDTTDLDFEDRFTSSPSASDHARLTSAVIKNAEASKPHGHAPDCDLYSANSSSTDALRWAIRQSCTVISQSFHRGTEPSGSGLQSDDILKDWMALRWPYPTILQAAGNFWSTDPDGISPPEDEFVNHKGFNSLAIGNHDDTAGAMAGDSVFRNPASTHGDRELPELAANGTGVTAVGETMSGTSFAAPAAAGVTALLQDVHSSLTFWPEGCRAILLASAGRNVAGRTWWSDVLSRTDASDGAGAVDAEEGVRIAQQRRWRDAPATRRGWDIGTLSSSVVGSDRLATFRHHISVPITLLAPTVKVALAWDSAVTSSGDTPTASTLTVDLDLLVRDSGGALVASAASWDNSYEVVEFAARPGETYEVVIRRWSGADSVWYGVAWTVSGLSIFFPWGDIFSELEPAG